MRAVRAIASWCACNNLRPAALPLLCAANGLEGMDATADRQQTKGFALSTLLDFACGSHARAAALLVALSLLMFLPGFFQIPPVDRDEARFAQATKQMVESGDYLDIHFQNEVRYKKPVGIYWLQASAVKAGEA